MEFPKNLDEVMENVPVRENEDDAELLLLSEAAARESQDTSNLVESGFEDLDGCMDGGFREGDFTIISGIPGDGKTTLGRMFTLNFAKAGIPSLWFSHEMSNRELWDSFDKMGADPAMIAHVPEFLQEDMDWMFRHIDRAIKQHGTKAVFIDTLGDLVKSVKHQQELGNYANYLAQMCKDLRNYAVKNKIMIFAVAHAIKQTRSGSNETNNSDIANSNGIAAAATNIFHVWRDNETDYRSFVKIGKSRRDGSKKNWKFAFRFDEGRLLPEGRHEDVAGESVWRST
jgi:KaiC/GvpD/RAD55 family RecA-like ATPase